MGSTILTASEVRFSPMGLCDSLDETCAGHGGLSILMDLVPDPTTKDVWTMRPPALAATPVATGQSIVVDFCLGDLIFGMRNSLTYPGYDEPFCYNLKTSVFEPISGVTASNIPLTQLTTGDWVPPTMDAMGVYVAVTHPGFDGINNFFGWFDQSSPTGLIWHAGNLAGPGSISALGTITPGSGYVNGFYTNVPFTSNSVATLGTITPGAGYVDGSYSQVPLTGGTGSSATADFVVAGGVVTVVNLDHGGVGFTSGDILSASNTNLGGSGSGFSIPVVTISSGSGATGNVTVAGGMVTDIFLVNLGQKYNDTDELTASNTFIGGSGSGFRVDVLSVNAGFLILPARPDWVHQFDQRLYFGVNSNTFQPATPFTDILALTATNANQVLTYGDNEFLTAAGALGLNNQNGGITQALIVFKGVTNMYQVTGDYALGTLAVNSLNTATGTNSPWSITNVPQGLMFLSPVGFRVIDTYAHVSEPIGLRGTGVCVPFMNAISPTRIAAASNASVMRVSVQPSTLVNTPFVEYWFDLDSKVWTGPHTFPARNIVVHNGSFVIVPYASPTQLFTSSTIPTIGDSNFENGNPLQFIWRTIMLADPGKMSEMNVSELTVNMGLIETQGPINIALEDENGAVMGSTIYISPATSETLWDVALWDVDLWDGGSDALRPRECSFPAPVVYRRIAVRVSGNSAAGFQISDTYIRRQILGYLQGVP